MSAPPRGRPCARQWVIFFGILFELIIGEVWICADAVDWNAWKESGSKVITEIGLQEVEDRVEVSMSGYHGEGLLHGGSVRVQRAQVVVLEERLRTMNLVSCVELKMCWVTLL